MGNGASWVGSPPSPRGCTARWLDSVNWVSAHFRVTPDVDTPEWRPLSVAGESLEETVSREVAEEVGLEVHSISYSSSQHWPFPRSSLMLACHALVSPAHTQVGAR